MTLLLGTTALIPMWMMTEPQDASGNAQTKPGSRGRRHADLGLTRLTVKLATPNFLIGVGAAILIPYMNVFFKDQFEISDSLLGLLFSLSSLFIGVGSLIGPRLSTAARWQDPHRGVHTACQCAVHVDDRIRPLVVDRWFCIPDARRVDEHVCAVVFRFLHGANPRTPAGTRKQRAQHCLADRLVCGTLYLGRCAATLWIPAFIYHNHDVVFDRVSV